MQNCFIICPLGSDGSEIRKRSDMLLKHVIAPVLEEQEYVPLRADKIPKAGLITAQIINLIIESPLVIVDLTGGNPNVFYELAVRHVTGKPYIQLIAMGETIPFDISGLRTIIIDLTNLDSVDLAKQQIKEQIIEFDKGHKPESPISLATTIRLLKSDETYAEELVEKIESISGSGFSNIDDLDNKLDYLDNKLDDLDVKLNDILSKIDTIEDKVSEIDGKIDNP